MGGRGLGGIGILWHKSIGATPVGGISSDQDVRLGSTRVCDGCFSSATWGYWKHLGFSRSILDACVVPILLYEYENWLMTHTLMEKVESFQEELAKTVLKWPKHHCNTAALECRQ